MTHSKPTLKNFYLTIGQQYHYEPHPLGLSPDQFCRIIAPDELAARNYAFAACGSKWAFLYTEEEFHPEYFPEGEAFSVTVSEPPHEPKT